MHQFYLTKVGKFNIYIAKIVEVFVFRSQYRVMIISLSYTIYYHIYISLMRFQNDTENLFHIIKVAQIHRELIRKKKSCLFLYYVHRYHLLINYYGSTVASSHTHVLYAIFDLLLWLIYILCYIVHITYIEKSFPHFFREEIIIDEN